MVAALDDVEKRNQIRRLAGAKAASLTLSARARDISSLAMKLTNQSASNIMDKMASARAAVMQNASVPLTALNLFLQCWEEIH